MTGPVECKLVVSICALGWSGDHGTGGLRAAVVRRGPLNLAYHWFCRLSLEDEVPNHSTFSKNRHGRFRDSDLSRWLFNAVLRCCMDAGLVMGEGFAVDASIIKADASQQRGIQGDEPVT